MPVRFLHPRQHSISARCSELEDKTLKQDTLLPTQATEGETVGLLLQDLVFDLTKGSGASSKSPVKALAKKSPFKKPRVGSMFDDEANV